MRIHNGQIIKKTGDGFLATFTSATEAVSCADEIQRELRRDDQDSAATNRANIIAYFAVTSVVLLAVLAVWACAVGGPTVLWLHGGVGIAGTERGSLSANFDDRNHLRRQLAEQRRALLWTVDGVDAGVAFERSGCGYRLDGVSAGGLHDAPGDAMSGLIGAALHPTPRLRGSPAPTLHSPRRPCHLWRYPLRTA